MRLIISGAGGFLGSALLTRLAEDSKHEVTGIFRVAPKVSRDPPIFSTVLGHLEPDEDWSGIPPIADALIHTAARVHIMTDSACDPLAEYRRINVEGTLNLARQAAAVGLRRFIFVSTMKVNGESTKAGGIFSADDTPAPSDPYSQSKWEAEQGLREIALRTGMELIIIRPPLVYGPGVKGNFRTMARWLIRGIPLPLGAIRNRRSLVYLGNLVHLIVTCLDHPSAANQVFLVSDGQDMSTPELLRRTGAALGTPARLFFVPAWLLMATAAAMGKREVARRLCDSLCADISKTRRLLNWNPPISVEMGLRSTAESFLREAHI